jgi:hypothetical protein
MHKNLPTARVAAVGLGHAALLRRDTAVALI